jgi:hypothetical protein
VSKNCIEFTKASVCTAISTVKDRAGMVHNRTASIHLLRAEVPHNTIDWQFIQHLILEEQLIGLDCSIEIVRTFSSDTYPYKEN